MKERLQGVLAGVLIGAVSIGSIAYATTGTRSIEVIYDNIKVYKDNVLCELKDANGSVIEPFIYNGTTYMPVRGTANLADMQVTWDGANNSVYLWDELVPDGTYLMEVCPPYETSSNYESYLQSEGKSFTMSGTRYSNGFTLCDCEDYALFNLNGRYSSIEFTIGHVDDSGMQDTSVSFLVDGKLVEEVYVGMEDLPKTVLIPVNYGLQLKIITSDLEAGGWPYVGFGNITVR